ncbi:unnamed protein product [Symbiodinium natans]|uniref:Pentatricopeptide repeat-containing protein, chloroplastic n=1 Tax=Symbiodinium natans TaxID=878477 RepID=A0A812IGM6_9DINO|nr:unnamed protein product [Symbiodinium natans]
MLRASRVVLEAYQTNLTIAAASRSSAWRLALATLQEAIAPDLVSFNSAAAACARAAQWRRALLLLVDLEARSLHADHRTWTPLLAALPWHHALMALAALETREMGNVQTVETACPLPAPFAATLSAAARDRAWATVLALMQRLKQSTEAEVATAKRAEAERARAVGLSAAIKSLVEVSRWPLGLCLVQEAQADLRSRCDSVLVSTCMLACRAGALWQLGLDLLDLLCEAEGKGAKVRTAVCHNSAISACAVAGQWLMALRLLCDAERMEILDMTTCNAAISACDRAHAWQHALQVLGVAEGRRLRADTISCATAISCCASAAEWTVALALFTRDLQPGAFSLSALVAACGAARCWERGLAIWQGWPFKLDLTCHNAALYLLAPVGQWVAALEVLRAMRRACEFRVELWGGFMGLAVAHGFFEHEPNRSISRFHGYTELGSLPGVLRGRGGLASHARALQGRWGAGQAFEFQR